MKFNIIRSYISLFLVFNISIVICKSQPDKLLELDKAKTLNIYLDSLDGALKKNKIIYKDSNDAFNKKFSDINSIFFELIPQSTQFQNFVQARAKTIDIVNDISNKFQDNYNPQEFLLKLNSAIEELANEQLKLNKDLTILSSSQETKKSLLRFNKLAQDFLNSIKQGVLNNKRAYELKDRFSLEIANVFGSINFDKNKSISLDAMEKWENVLTQIVAFIELYQPILNKAAQNIKVTGLSIMNNFESFFNKRALGVVDLRILLDKFIDDQKTLISNNLYELNKSSFSKTGDPAFNILIFTLDSYQSVLNKIKNSANQYLDSKEKKEDIKLESLRKRDQK